MLCVTPLAEHDFDFVPAGKEPNEPAVVCARARASARPLDPTLATDTHAGRYYSRRLVRAARCVALAATAWRFGHRRNGGTAGAACLEEEAFERAAIQRHLAPTVREAEAAVAAGPADPREQQPAGTPRASALAPRYAVRTVSSDGRGRARPAGWGSRTCCRAQVQCNCQPHSTTRPPASAGSTSARPRACAPVSHTAVHARVPAAAVRARRARLLRAAAAVSSTELQRGELARRVSLSAPLALALARERLPRVRAASCALCSALKLIEIKCPCGEFRSWSCAQLSPPE